MEIVLNKFKLIQFISTIISLVITVFIPILNYYQFKGSLTSDVDLGGFEATYDIFIILIVTVGIIITGCTYFIFNFPKFSIKRGSISLTHSVLDLVLIYFYSFMSIVTFSYTCEKNCQKEVTLDLSGVFIVLIIIWSLFVGKNAYDLIDYKINETHYKRINSKRNTKKPKLIKCSKCNYMCKIEWKKCPICNSSLLKKRK